MSQYGTEMNEKEKPEFGSDPQHIQTNLSGSGSSEKRNERCAMLTWFILHLVVIILYGNLVKYPTYMTYGVLPDNTQSATRRDLATDPMDDSATDWETGATIPGYPVIQTFMQASDKYYAMFQDIHVMMFIGFGFLMSFLSKYQWSSVGFTLWICSVVIEVSILWRGLMFNTFNHHWNDYIDVNITSLIRSDYACCTVLVAFGALIGKVSFNQLTFIAISQLFWYHTNEAVLINEYIVQDAGGSMIIHMFGGIFGMVVACFVTDKNHLKNAKNGNKDSTSYTSGTFTFIGTVFLWLFWPSFNAAMAVKNGRDRAVVNTVLGLVSSCIMAFIWSRVCNPSAKFDLTAIQHASLAGGVAMGANADSIATPWKSMIIGVVAGFFSVLVFHYTIPWLYRKFNIHDTAGVLALHIVPGLIGSLASIANVANKYADYFETTLVPGRDNKRAGLFQFIGIVTTIGFALLGGIVTGVFCKIGGKIFSGPLKTESKSRYFTDQLEWEHHEFVPNAI